MVDTPDSLARDMLKAAVEAAAGTRAIVQKSSQAIKTQARVNVSQTAPVQNAHAQYAITYDTKVDLPGGKINAEIGYDKDKPGGALGNILEYGSRHNGPHRDLGRAADVEESRFMDALGLMASKLL